MAAPERYYIIEKTYWIKPLYIYSKDVLTLEEKSEYLLVLGGGYVIVSTGNKKL